MSEVVIIEGPILFFPNMMSVYLKDTSLAIDILGRMQPRTRQTFLSLSNAKDISVPQLMGIMATNGIGISLKKGSQMFGGIFLDISRINHSCGPNITWIWNRYLFVNIVQASRNTHKGEEIITEYETLDQTYADRRFELERKYNFKCTYDYCTNTPATSDHNRAYYTAEDTMDLKFRHLSIILLASLQVQDAQLKAADLLQYLTRGLVTLTKEGIEATHAQMYYVYLMQVYGLQGDEKNFLKWGFKAILMYTGNSLYRLEREIEQWIGWMQDPKRNFPHWAILLE
ncbi:hypothetical protein M422DRAFT_275073 [Sphaerobolus stellatus SS14]|uniref:SET domain-containing protein n=1 Tax=Sphaerobolus stellatus (strain SS14) TaxID=990650 RepID=A0A0C9T5M7_SPHS4|nr:hypothetical protein M422DRAFT_275073 [Sphaerobolus stellatus SS14]